MQNFLGILEFPRQNFLGILEFQNLEFLAKLLKNSKIPKN